MKDASQKDARGPKPERLKLEGDWQEAVKKALSAKPPKRKKSAKKKK